MLTASAVEPVRAPAPAPGRRGSPPATRRPCRRVCPPARSRAPSPSRPRSRAALPRISITSCARTRRRVDDVLDLARPWRGPAPATRSRADQERPEHTLATGGPAGAGEHAVGAHDVADVGEVAPRVRVAGDDADRVVARLEPARHLAGERGERVDRRLARAGVVERARAHAPAVRARRRRSRPAGRPPPCSPRTGSAAAAARPRRPAARPAARTPRPTRRRRRPPRAPRRARPRAG